MEYAEAIVRVHDSLQEAGYRREYCGVGGKEESSVGQHRAESTHDEEKELDDRQKDCPIDEFIYDNLQPSVQNRPMLEQYISEAIEVPHLHI